jgi:hypothetical protein
MNSKSGKHRLRLRTGWHFPQKRLPCMGVHVTNQESYPFALAPGTDGQFVVCNDEASDMVSDTEGAAMFDITGTPTQLVSQGVV